MTEPTPKTVERIHVGLVDGIPRPKADGAYVYYVDYRSLERALARRDALLREALQLVWHSELAERIESELKSSS